LGVNGAYELSLVVGDSFIQNSFTWKVATLNLKFSSRIAASESPFSVKPEITHIFRAPDVRATKSLSSLFTIASLAPLAILFIGVCISFPSLFFFLFGLSITFDVVVGCWRKL
jgi:oligosaccharyltransferase complex subunit delta (ribophorin II)